MLIRSVFRDVETKLPDGFHAQKMNKILNQVPSNNFLDHILTLPIIECQLPADICRRAVSAANLNGA